MKPWFIIGGSFRSGTTLLRLCLNSHPRIHVFDEQLSYPMMQQVGELRAKPFHDPEISAVGFKIPVISQEVECRIGDWTERFGSPPRIIWTQREVVQIVASMKATWGNSGLDRFEKNVTEWRKDSKFKKLHKKRLKALDSLLSHEKKIAYATLLALHKQEAYQRLTDVHLIFYEELVKNPEATLRAALTCLGVEWNDAVLAHHTMPHTESGVGGTSPTRPIDPVSVELWKERLTDREVAIIRSVEGAINV